MTRDLQKFAQDHCISCRTCWHWEPGFLDVEEDWGFCGVADQSCPTTLATFFCAGWVSDAEAFSDGDKDGE